VLGVRSLSFPCAGAIALAAATFKDKKGIRGRPRDARKTTKVEDRVILTKFKKLRPPGCGVDARVVHAALPKKIKAKVGRRTVIRRLAEKGYKPERKIQKTDPGPALASKRTLFAQKYAARTADEWTDKLQAVGDMKDFTWYPNALQSKFKRLRAPWTYMTKAEKKLPAFVRPKRWFPKKEYLKAKKQKVFGISTSSGKSLAFLVPKPWDSQQWAKEVKKRVVPFFKNAFPGKTSFTILLDGEKLLHAPVAKAAMTAGGIKTLQGWPKSSPDLNPQENV